MREERTAGALVEDVLRDARGEDARGEEDELHGVPHEQGRGGHGKRRGRRRGEEGGEDRVRPNGRVRVPADVLGMRDGEANMTCHQKETVFDTGTKPVIGQNKNHSGRVFIKTGPTTVFS
jgi:hypothetical protein